MFSIVARTRLEHLSETIVSLPRNGKEITNKVFQRHLQTDDNLILWPIVLLIIAFNFCSRKIVNLNFNRRFN